MPISVPDPSAAPDALRLVVGALGALSALFGARLYKPALFGAAFATGVVGVFAAATLVPAGTVPATALLITALVAGVAVAIVAGLAHRVALVAVGAIAGAVAGLAVTSVFVLPLWVPLVGAVLGALALPWGFKGVLKWVTPVIGAVLIGWALGWLDRPLWLLPIVLVGIVFQLSTGKRKRRSKDDE